MTRLCVDWVLSGDRRKASSRLQGFLIHEWMLARGHASRILATDFNTVDAPFGRTFVEVAVQARRSPADVVVFEGPEWPMVMLARLCSLWGRRTIAVRCDRLPGDYDRFFDATILPTQGLRRELGVARGIVIDDAVEVPAEVHKRDYAGGARLRVGWVGHPSYEKFIVPFVEELRQGLGEGFEFVLISQGAFATRQWSEETVLGDILSCDVALLPIPAGEWFVNKSSNRLAMMFALGMPTVASPIPSYTGMAEDGVDVCFAGDATAFRQRLLELRSPQRREALGRRARESLGSRFHLDTIGPQWVRAMTQAERLRRFDLKTAAFGALVGLAALSRPARPRGR